MKLAPTPVFVAAFCCSLSLSTLAHGFSLHEPPSAFFPARKSIVDIHRFRVSPTALKDSTDTVGRSDGDDESSWIGTIGELDYHRLDIDGNQQVNPKSSQDKLLQWIDTKKLTDIIVVSHGWNTLPAAAKANYDDLFGHVSSLLQKTPIPSRKFGVIGITWPSKYKNSKALMEEFPEDAELLREIDRCAQALIDAGGDPAKIFQDGAVMEPQQEAIARARADYGLAVFQLFDKDQAEDYAYDGNSYYEYLKNLPLGPELEADLFGKYQKERYQVFESLDFPDPTTFYFMMKRGSRSGILAVAPLLAYLREANSVYGKHQHLIGHSFGGLLVSAAAWKSAEDDGACQFASMTLLQGAFSQNSFRSTVPNTNDKPGMFRSVVTNNVVSGPFAATFTENDWALGYGYPLGARLWNVIGTTVPLLKLEQQQQSEVEALQQAEATFGAVGANGVTGLTSDTSSPVQELKKSPAKVNLADGKVNNLIVKDKAVIGGHTKVWNENIANLIIQMLQSTT